MKANAIDRVGMIIIFRCRGLNPRAWRSPIESQIRKLQHLAAITAATITLERQNEAKGKFTLFTTLEVPGPDFHAEATDYTVQAVLLKVLRNLRHQIQSRKGRQRDRRKHNDQLGVLPGRSPLALAPAGAAPGGCFNRTTLN